VTDTDRIAALEARIADLEARLAAAEAGSAIEPGSEPSDRRAFLRLAAAGAVGAVGATAALGGGRPAGADDEDSLVAGEVVMAGTSGPRPTGVRYLWNTVAVPGQGQDQGACAFTVTDDNTIPGDDGLGTPFPASLGGFATGPYVVGVTGTTTVTGGFGVIGYADGPGTGAYFSGGRANVRLEPASASPPSRADAHDRGELLADSAGDLWFCTDAGVPGTWVRLTAPAPGLNVLPAPRRVFDSRFTGKFSLDEERVVDLALHVPERSTAAVFTLTATEANGPGFLAAFADGVNWASSPFSSLSFDAVPLSIATTVLSAVSEGRAIRVHCGGGEGVQAHVVVDVIGYFG
jgi:hypothetical protein